MSISHTRVKRSIQLLVCTFLGFSSTAFSYTFELSEAEFLAWPAYCRVVYLRTDIGKASGYTRLVSPSDLAAGGAVLREAEQSGRGPYGGDGRHHFCAGMIWLDRARRADPQERRGKLGQAKEETKFTLRNADRVNPQGESFALAAAQMASIMYEAGDEIAALNVLNDAISRPNLNPALFITKAMINYREGDYENSRAALEEAARRADSVNAEIHYNLGLILLKLGDPESAAEQAYLAYDNGYALPGLRHKLERAGYWNPKN